MSTLDKEALEAWLNHKVENAEEDVELDDHWLTDPVTHYSDAYFLVLKAIQEGQFDLNDAKNTEAEAESP